MPRQIRENGLRPEEIVFQDEALEHGHSRLHPRGRRAQSGARDRAPVPQGGHPDRGGQDRRRAEITPEVASEFLGKPRFFGNEEVAERTSVPGVATGLAWTPSGGEVLFIEATAMPGGQGISCSPARWAR